MVLSSTVGVRLVAPSTVLRVGEILISSGRLQVHMTPVSILALVSVKIFFFPQVYTFIPINIVSSMFFLFPALDKAAADQNAAWAAYYAQYYGQQPGGGMAAQAPGAAAAAPGDQSQAAQASGGQPDYTKAWEEYYKKMGMSKLDLLIPF